ncbi:MAG TPA: cytochrome P450 [Gemmataceae bacterium]|nr:cytochrome P450 [Gemmataceae bacterium]
MRRLLEGLFRSCFRSRSKPFDGIPGPAPIFPFGNLLEFRGAQPWDVFAEYEKKYGGITLIWAGATPMLVLNDPELIQEVLVTKHEDYYKNNPVKAFKPVLKTTEFDENGPEWQRLRKSEPLSMDGFDEWLPTQAPAVKKVVDAHVNRLTKSAKPVDLLPTMERMIYDAYNACIVGRQLDDQAYRYFYTTSNMATKRMQLPNWLLVPPLNPRFWYARHYHFGVFENIVREAKKDPDSGANDLLHVYLRKGTNVPDELIAMFLGNVHAGGVFSAGTALANTLYLLSRNAEVAEKLYAQLRAAASAGTAPEQCPLLDHVLRESMRYFPPVPMFFRNVLKTKSAQLGNYTLPPDTMVNVVVQGVHRSPKYWKEPDRFDPSRWENGTADAPSLDSDYYFPFGRGPRICIGASLAMFCMKAVLATILSKVQVRIDAHVPYRQFFHCGVAEPKGIEGSFVP